MRPHKIKRTRCAYCKRHVRDSLRLFCWHCGACHCQDCGCRLALAGRPAALRAA